MSTKLETILNHPIYDNLRNRTDILFLCFGGSHAYGTNNENSDIDIRGVKIDSFADILLMSDIEDEERDTDSDTVIYGLNKFLNLATDCNPNIIEMLGCAKEDYAMVSPLGQMLLDNRKLFLSKKAYDSFAGYARGQFNRMRNALLSIDTTCCEKQFYLRDSLQRLHTHLEKQFPTFTSDMITYHIYDENETELTFENKTMRIDNIVVNVVGLDAYYIDANGIQQQIDLENTKLALNINAVNINPKEFKSIYTEISSFMRDYDKYIGHRNKKKDDYHIDKHANHLERLYDMGIDIFEQHDIMTNRVGRGAENLRFTLSGGWRNTDNKYKPEFFDYIDAKAVRLSKACDNSTLPDKPDYEQIKTFKLQLMKTIVLDYLKKGDEL